MSVKEPKLVCPDCGVGVQTYPNSGDEQELIYHCPKCGKHRHYAKVKLND